jgi:molybdopterin converting factor small subunit
MQITISFYGSFRRLGTSVVLYSDRETTVGNLRKLLVEEIGTENTALVYDSVFANDTTILNDEEKILSSCGLSILPPVCGG